MIKINFNPFGHWLYYLWKEKEQETFIEYTAIKYTFNQAQLNRFRSVCQVVSIRGKFLIQDLMEIQKLGIPLGKIDEFNLSGFRERTSPVSYDTFVTYLVNICDNKFTKEQIKQTIENGKNI